MDLTTILTRGRLCYDVIVLQWPVQWEVEHILLWPVIDCNYVYKFYYISARNTNK